jgi:RNA polymerase sigma-70 factor (ECF subfamily)
MGTIGLTLPWEARISDRSEGLDFKIPGQDRLGHGLRHGEKRLTRPESTEGAGSTTTEFARMAAEDATLLSACRSGDLGAFERLYLLHSSRMKSVARNLLGTTSDAEDAVQETFLKIQRGIARFRGQSSFVTWSFRILINTCYDARRSRLRKKEVAQEPDEAAPRPEPRAPAAHPSLRIALERALGQLSRQQRDVFLLYEVDGFRHSEIASMLDISETASKNTLFQAKKNLRQVLEAPRSSARETR